jgi:hypothetical protein
MFRKLLILGAIAALFTIATAVPASALAVDTGNGAKTVVPQFNEGGLFSNAHGPMCGPLDCPNNDSAGNVDPGPLTNPFVANVGAWNGVFQSNIERNDQSNDKSAVCGITATIAEVPKELIGTPLGDILVANTCESP